MTIVYKIFRADEYADFVARGETAGAPIDIQDGYVHMSTADQVVETAAKHFAGEDRLKVLAIDSDELGEDVRWEPSRGGALFPHLYRSLKVDDVLWTRDLPWVGKSHDFGGVLP